jgi:N-acetylglucosaminyl-diphospho-decaprenol L-rhamnosyltransferase
LTRTAVSAVIVHYHAAELAAHAVDSLRREAAAASAAGRGVDLEVMVVDNGSDAAGRRRLAELPCRLLEPGSNLGYAGGLNLGAGEAAGEVLLFANPDVELLPGCLARLLATLDEGADVAGPRFVWDRAGRLLLPPAERRGRRDELLAPLAERGDAWARRARRRWRRHARRHWLATAALPSPALSGALLAVRRGAWQRTGPFDPGYRLYFEESDWLRRAGRAGLRLVHEPRALVVHHYNRSAAGEPRAQAWFAESAERYALRWHGPVFRRLRDLATPARSRLVHPPAPPSPAPGSAGPPRLELSGRLPREGGGWIELSPVPRGFPAAGERLAAGAAQWTMPEEVWRHLGEGRWRLALVGGDGGELGAWSFAGPAGEGGGR